jgi:hypothetical protein
MQYIRKQLHRCQDPPLFILAQWTSVDFIAESAVTLVSFQTSQAPRQDHGFSQIEHTGSWAQRRTRQSTTGRSHFKDIVADAQNKVDRCTSILHIINGNIDDYAYSLSSSQYCKTFITGSTSQTIRLCTHEFRDPTTYDI